MDGLSIFFTVLAIIAVVFIVLYFVGRRLQKKTNESMKIVDANRQFVNGVYVIDKKKARLTEASFPKSVMDQIPRRMRWMKMPLVKVKIGPQIVTMFTDKQIYDAIPLKTSVRLEISGGYILGFSTQKKGEKKVEYQRKLTWREKFGNRLSSLQSKANEKVK